MIIKLIIAGVMFFYGMYNLGPTKEDNNSLGVTLILVSIVFFMFVIFKSAMREGKERKALFIAAKAFYDKALFDLQEDPDSSEKYQKALLKGREYYAYLHPNTYDMNRNGVTSNHQDNSGVIELKVQSDLQARTLKPKGKIS